ncbi:hypothetical protein [Acidovorax sp. BLS4]|uniref:hypothetical protein n=1 Tax=Acidovorax sp. BLS4 TaxID=3273430 RepID=UPI0029437AD5|nr:hypothetical protein [Paracidovorax avenae]WOI46965.1 hypothetical protein R1Z03_07070 [Paracidovorax avenae]
MILTPPPGDPAVAADIPSRRNDSQEVFDLKSDNYMAWLAGFRNWLASFRTWTVTARDEVNQLRAATDAVAQDAAAASASAMATAGFKGAWANLAGPLAPPASVLHDQQIWLLKVPVADVQAHVPGVSANWLPLDQAGAQPALRNRLINGNCAQAQRGSSFTGATVATGNYPVDRLTFTGSSTTAVVTLEQGIDGPEAGLRRNARVTVTTADAAMTGAKSAGLQQVIEGYNIADLFGVTFTVTFMVRSAKAGVHCLALFNASFDRSFVGEYTVNAPNTWESKAVTVFGGLPTTGGWNTTNGAGLYVRWGLGVGATYQTQAGAWRESLYLGSPNQVNCLDTAGNVFAITGFELKRGSFASRFEHRPHSLELDLCKRYYEQLNNANGYTYAVGMVPNNNQVWVPLNYSEKRASPTLTFPGDIDKYQFQLGGGTASCTARPFVSSAGVKSAFVILPSTSAGLASDSKACLALLSGNARIEISAEL